MALRLGALMGAFSMPMLMARSGLTVLMLVGG
jgi:hypothetical protein